MNVTTYNNRVGRQSHQLDSISGRSQNTVPIASTQVAIKGTVQYSTRASERAREQTVSQSKDREQLATRHSREHTLSAVGPDAPVE